ncbi:MAG TPA: YfiR family protein [Verrucomicrobiae bacterium]
MNPSAKQNFHSAAGALARWLKWLLCSWAVLVIANATVAEEPVSKEYQIKAAYLYNFAKFVQWPEERFATGQTPLVIGVFGRNPFGGELQAIARDHKINGRAIVIKPVATVAEARTVHLLFMSAAESNELAPRLAALDGAGVLTVGESEAFAEDGGMIVFVREADKVRFHINAAAAEHAGLKISAQLLKLSQVARK